MSSSDGDAIATIATTVIAILVFLTLKALQFTGMALTEVLRLYYTYHGTPRGAWLWRFLGLAILACILAIPVSLLSPAAASLIVFLAIVTWALAVVGITIGDTFSGIGGARELQAWKVRKERPA